MNKDQAVSFGMAKRRRRSGEISPHYIVMATVTCEQCGEQFAISHRPALQDANLAQRQIVWLEDRLVWDHIQEHKHSGSTMLPGPPELKTASPPQP